MIVHHVNECCPFLDARWLLVGIKTQLSKEYIKADFKAIEPENATPHCKAYGKAAELEI